MQAKKIEAYATVKDWTLHEVIRDEGVSAKSLKRPGMARLRRLHSAGLPYQAIAEALTADGVPTALGGCWSSSTVFGLLRTTPTRAKRRVA